MLGEDFVTERVSTLLSQVAKDTGPILPPIDPARMAALCSVIGIEERPMVPEGVLRPVAGGFRIYLQNNFSKDPSFRLRKRFTLAHEIAHTFFFDICKGVPKPVKHSPRGQRLENLCHTAAGQILVPESLLKQQLNSKGEVASVETLFDLSKIFDVSVEVMIRRLHRLGLFAVERFAAVLVNTTSGGKKIIKAACFGPLLTCNASRPRPGMDFDSWVVPLLGPLTSPEESQWTQMTSSARISAKKVYRSSRSFILDLRFEPPSADREISRTSASA